MKCRHCGVELKISMVDLGSAPPSNAFLTRRALREAEQWFPLRVLVCHRCWLAQTEYCFDAHDLFGSDYAYFSGYSSTWQQHCERFVSEAVERFRLDASSRVVEIAANDGHLLQHMLARKIPCVGIEPTASTAAAARAKGIPMVEAFFTQSLAEDLARRGKQADLAIANNVLAHVPDINGFIAGFAQLLKPKGVATFEFPHILQILEKGQFDTIYHEHYSYLSLTAVERIFAANGLSIFDVEKLSTHGGSLRVFSQRSDTGHHHRSRRVNALLHQEEEGGLRMASTYTSFQAKAEKAKNCFLEFLLAAKERGKTVAAYGAAAKGSSLLNFAGVRPDLLAFVADRNPCKQGKFMPGSRIPVVNENHLKKKRPDYVIVLPWNLENEITAHLSYVLKWTGRFVVVIPQLRIVP